MKAIVANVLFGGIFGCLSCANSTQANPVAPKPVANKKVVSASISPKTNVSLVPRIINSFGNVAINSLYGYSPSLNREYHQWLKESAAINFIPSQSTYFPDLLPVEADCSLAFCSDFSIGDRPETQTEQLLALEKQPYIHSSPTAGVALGFQNTFWSSKNNQKYWGVTTVEHWGDSQQQLDPSQLNYTNSAPALTNGSSILTFSGGGNRNLVNKANLDRNSNLERKFEDFRGGIAYHRGVTKGLTMGVGFIYEDIFAGFTQLTYDSDILPITTTLSLITKESAIDLHSHVRFQPSKSFVANYYHDGEHQKFDANLGIYPGLNLIAKGNSKQKNYSMGIKVAVQNNLFSLTATAALDRERNLQWQLNSQIGRFKFVHGNDTSKTNSELSNQPVDFSSLGFQCSAFVKYQTKVKQGEFVVWGGKFNSQAKVSQDRHLWSFDLGYGTGSQGKGWIANSSVALKPSLFLKLNYQEVSAVSDETKIKLELSSR